MHEAVKALVEQQQLADESLFHRSVLLSEEKADSVTSGLASSHSSHCCLRSSLQRSAFTGSGLLATNCKVYCWPSHRHFHTATVGGPIAIRLGSSVVLSLKQLRLHFVLSYQMKKWKMFY